MTVSRINIKDEIFERTTRVNRIYDEFSKDITDNIFYINKKGLLYGARKVSFEYQKWNLNPKMFCIDWYDEQDYYMIILLANDLNSYFEFHEDNFENKKIIVPTESKIKKIIQGL